MKFTLQATVWAGAIFGLASLGAAITGFSSLGEIADPIQHSDARGFAWFWTFLALVCGGLAALAWWMARGVRQDE